MILTIHHRKGGVGKTTTAQHLAFAAAKAGLQVCAIDCDGQANLSHVFGVECEAGQGIGEVFSSAMAVQAIDWSQVAVRISSTLMVVPACPDAFKIQDQIANYDGHRAGLLEAALEDPPAPLVIIDTPASETWFSKNALLAASHIVTPFQSIGVPAKP